MNKLPTRDEFYRHLNEKFRVFFDGQTPTEVLLTEVSELRPRNRFAAFDVVFFAPKSVPQEQYVARIEHDALGEFELMLVPFAENENGTAFEALFNQPFTGEDD